MKMKSGKWKWQRILTGDWRWHTHTHHTRIQITNANFICCWQKTEAEKLIKKTAKYTAKGEVVFINKINFCLIKLNIKQQIKKFIEYIQ